MGISYLLLAAGFGTWASLIYVYVYKISQFSIPVAFLGALALWTPTNFFSTKAQTIIKSVTTVLIVFSIASTLTDTFGGLVIQQAAVKDPIKLLIGLVLGLIIIYYGSKSKNIDLPDPMREVVLYGVGAALLVWSYLHRDNWALLVVVYGISDLLGAVLVQRLLKLVPEKIKFKVVYEFLIGLVAFAPVTFSVVLLLRVIGNIAIAGPAATIMSCGLATFGVTLLTFKWSGFKGLWKTVKLEGLKDVVFLVVAIVCVVLIYQSF
ncbi:MAG TPA: hypothetical protein VLI92_02885 [Candidatus Saccharimonadales bacterium]|nr:hypothetical protein [Candidatus Saccharimonadales bacterium]